MIKEKIKQINFAKKKVFAVVVIIGVALLVGGSFALSESGWIKIIGGKKVVDIEKMEKEFNRQMKEGNVVMLEEVKQEIPVIESQKCDSLKCEEEFKIGRSCGSLLGRLDPNERSEEVCKIFWDSRDLIKEGMNDEARILLENGIAQFPESRHLHKQLSKVLWYIYEETDISTLPALKGAIKEAELALNIGLSFGTVDSQLTSLLSMLLSESKDVETLDRIFERIFEVESNVIFYEDYVRALSAMNDPRAEEIFKKIIELKNNYASIEYVEWLLDQGRESEILLLSIEFSFKDRMAFYRGFALEKLGRLDEAKAEYAEYRDYYKYIPHNPELPSPLPSMPKRFQIPGSELQKEMKIRFESDEKDNSSTRIQTLDAISDGQAIMGLSYLVFGEAGGETLGGMRAVGWIVRSRVLRGSIGPYSCLLGVDNTGSTLAEQYKSVMCQSGQFDGMCLAWCSDPNTEKCANDGTYNSAYDVYFGYTPDPVAPHCPGGIVSWNGSYCADTTYCYGYTGTYRLDGPVLNFGTPGSCPSPHPGLGCGPDSVGKTCGNAEPILTLHIA